MLRPLRSLSFALLMFAAAGRASAQTVFVKDSFTGVNGTLLEAHTPNTGGAWTRILGNGLNIQTNALRATATNAFDIYTNSTTAPSADYVVGMSVTFTNANANNFINLVGRGSIALQSGYLAQVGADGAITVWPVLGGAIQPAIINTTTTMTLNVQHLVILSMKGNQISISLDGTVFGPVTDNSVTTAGVVGLGLNANNITQATADDFFAGTFAVTEVRMRTTAARHHDGRSLIEWTTGRETSNLGFRVWRQDGDRRTLVTPSPIAGSAFLSRATLTAGNSYRWLDEAATARSRYWIESIGVDGRREWNGPIVPTGEAFDETEIRTPLLRDAGQRVAPATASQQPHLTVAANDLRRAVVPPDTLTKQQALAAGAAVKISVDADGWYRVTRDELLAAGLDPATSPRRLHLYTDARAVPITVEGESQNRIDAIRFYGTALDTPSTARRVYWLVAEEAEGRRIPTAAAASGDKSASSFLVTAERRDKSIFFAALANGNKESFFGPVITSDAMPATQTLQLAHIDRAAATADVDIALQGGTDFAAGPDPGHDVAVSLNGHTLDDIRFSGRDAIDVRRSVPLSWLADGDNTFTFMAKNGAGDLSLVSFVRVTYAHTYDFDGGPLVLTAEGGSAVGVGGTMAATVYALDVTAPSSPIELSVTVDNGVARFTATPGARRTIIATTDFAKAARVEANRPSSLHSARGVDMVIIAHPSLLPAVEPLRQLRAAQGLSVLVAPVDDIYDEYGYGDKDPAVIRTFLSVIHPRFVLLVGDATFDPRNYLGLGDFDLVPTKLISTQEMKTASDTWLVDFDDDGVSNLAIGRLPVRTLAEAQIEIGKIVAYENAVAAPDWAKSALLVTDSDGSLDFGNMSKAVRDLVPAGYTTDSIDVGSSGLAAARQDLLGRFSRGALLVNFIGHGSVDVWTSGGLFAGSDARSLQNGGRLPFVVAMTCLNGYFHDVYTTSLAADLLRAPNGGAIGVFASSALTDAHAQNTANQELVRALLADRATFGEAAQAAQKHATDADVRRTFLLFGDPAMRLKQ